MVIRHGHVSVERLPFRSWPTAVAGGRFEAGAGEQIVLASSPEGRRKMRPNGIDGGSPLSVMCIDDVLVPQGLPVEYRAMPYDRVLAHLVEDVGVTVVDRRPLSPDSSIPESGEGPLVRLLEAVRFGGIDTGSVLLVSIGLQDLLRGVEPSAFERQLSVICDRLLELGTRRLVLVTPPPYPHHEVNLRAYSVAIRRVAEARRIPVADVFTGISGLGVGERLFFPEHNLALTARGHRLAAQILTKTLMEQNLIRRGGREGGVPW
jgi:hypothetical protein